jgi:DNA polymerase
MILYLDTETFSSVDLFKCGLGAYADSDDAEVMIVTYAIDEGEVKAWDRTLDPTPPADFEEAVMFADEIVFHNAPFDLTMMALPYPRGLGLAIPLEKVWCTMAQALAHGLEGALGKLSVVFKLSDDDAKSKRGSELMSLFCKAPLKGRKRDYRATRVTHPEEWSEFLNDYAVKDIRSMRVLRKKMPVWNFGPVERDLWRRTHLMNQRGVLLDLELADACIEAVAQNKVNLDAQVDEQTGGDVQSANQRDALLAHILAEYGVELPDMKGATLERRAKDESLPQAVRDLLALRMETATPSNAKYVKMRQVASRDGRARNLIQFNGASRTGRDAGRLIQPQNFPRPTLSEWEIMSGIELFKHRHYDLIPLVCSSVPKAASNALRGAIIAPPGCKLVVSDLSNIEGVSAAYLAGEDWKLEAYRVQFDDPDAPDMYRLAYGRSFGVDPMSITKAQRQLGKIQELALAYEGGVGAFVTFVLTYRMDLAAVAAAVLPLLAPDVYKQALGMLEWRRKKGLSTYGLSDDVFIACEALKHLWREAHPAISSYWKDLEDCAKRAIANPGQLFRCRKLAFRRDGVWLRMILPSGRAVCYPSAHVRDGKVYYQGVSQYTHTWGWIGTYGGKIFENACQAFARDCLFYSIPRIEAEGFDILLRAHDELICEADDSPEFSHDKLSHLMCIGEQWNQGMPLKAAGFEAARYRKDD